MQDSEIIKQLSEAMLKNHESHWALISRLQNKEPWTGEGLPPVGCEFERRFVDQESSSWAYGKVIAHGKRRVFYVDRTGDEWSHSPEDMEFRPIRTPEQIAAEKREADIEELRVLLSNVACDDYQAAVAMIDAGYRKQDNADERK